ncbi:hypothetical protein PsorP6_011676 [Peronosclerospora sorghi]|uniref:Uncharacterized protein n=1 Tax=Peronosclerospora sorghi TaxID=230839 RepID=A0ACC0WLW9_9STRA|nr:hypothetical protein PsorP6_011676 [Peronosclerospora sorghi]
MANIGMTGEGGANRTFRSIFGQRHDEVLNLERKPSDGSASVGADSGTEAAILVMDNDDDEAMWGEDLRLSGDEAVADNNDVSRYQSAHRKSMEEWADDDEEEEKWKDALQDRVNQLELAEFRSQSDHQQPHQFPAHAVQRVDSSASLPAHLAALGEDLERPRKSSRHKMRRTSSSHARITGNNAIQNHIWNFQRLVTSGTATTLLHQDSRVRCPSMDFVARNIKTVELPRKRSDSSGNDAASTTDLPLSWKKLPDNSRSSPSRRINSSIRGTQSAASLTDAASSSSSRAAVFKLSDTEAIRRFVLDDIKTMSMERLVNDAQRLHFLEDFYQNQHGRGHALSSSTSSTSAPVSSPSASFSSSAMSTS